MQLLEGTQELRVGSLVGTGLATLSIGVLQLGVAISLASLIFSGPLSSGAGRASVGFIGALRSCPPSLASGAV